MVSNFSKSSHAWKDGLKHWAYTCTFVAFLNLTIYCTLFNYPVDISTTVFSYFRVVQYHTILHCVIAWALRVLYFYYLQASGPLLQPLALGPLPVISSPSLPLMTTRQYCSQGNNHDGAESMTVFLWILSQWYVQRDTVMTQLLFITLQ